MIVALQLIIFLPLKPELVPQSQGRAFLLEIIMDEIWKDIKGYEGIYKVSNLGRVLSYKRSKDKPYLMKGAYDSCGYIQVGLTKNNKQTLIKRCRLVATHFIDNPENKETVNHIDGIKVNDKATNLEWATRSENMQHAVRTGLKESSKGEDNGQSILTTNDVLDMRNAFNLGCFDCAEIGRAWGIDRTHAWSVITRRSWKHV